MWNLQFCKVVNIHKFRKLNHIGQKFIHFKLHIQESVIYLWSYIYLQMVGKTETFSVFNVIQKTDWLIATFDANHLLRNGQNITRCAVVQKPWLCSIYFSNTCGIRKYILSAWLPHNISVSKLYVWVLLLPRNGLLGQGFITGIVSIVGWK
jgi:hypothetical protein